MANPQITKDDLRDRLDIIEVIGQYVRLQKAGNEHRGLCPFHDEKTPSFYVNAEKGLWVCRGACGEGGDVFAFVMKAEKLEFGEAAELLASRLGYSLRGSEREARRADQRERVLEVCRLATGLFERALWHGEGGQVARDYLARRGLGEEVIKRFRLGYAPPGWDNLTRYLIRHDLPLADAEAAGLLKPRERSTGYYDRFRGRVMFPILDTQGRTVGFGGRVLDPHDEPKYLNSPESPVFSKGRLLYGLPFAVGTLAEGAVVVEGYMDVIALHEHGVTNAVATLGTALTVQHLRLLRRHTAQVTLCYDADLAGQRATDRAAATFLEEGMEARVLALPAGQDPDDFVRSQGREQFEARLREAPDVIDHRLQTVVAEAGNDPAKQDAAVREAVVAILGDINDPVRQAQYVRRIAEWWSSAAVGLQEEFERTLTRALRDRGRLDRGGAGPVRSGAAPAARLPDRAIKVERRLLQLCLQGSSARARVSNLAAEGFTNEGCRELFEAIQAAAADFSPERMVEALSETARTLIADLACGQDEETDDLERVIAEFECLVLERQAEALRRRRNAPEVQDFEAQAALYKEWIALQQRLDETRRTLNNASGMR